MEPKYKGSPDIIGLRTYPYRVAQWSRGLRLRLQPHPGQHNLSLSEQLVSHPPADLQATWRILRCGKRSATFLRVARRRFENGPDDFGFVWIAECPDDLTVS